MNREQFDEYIRQEFSEGVPIDPAPMPPPPIQYSPVPKQWEPGWNAISWVCLFASGICFGIVLAWSIDDYRSKR
jgi:hypothetical protein